VAISRELEDDIAAGELDIARGRAHTWPEWQDLEADGVLCLGYANWKSGEHVHWPSQETALQVIREGALEAQGPIKVTTNDDFPRAEVIWLADRLRRSEYERGQMKAENRRLLRRLRKLRHKRHR